MPNDLNDCKFIGRCGEDTTVRYTAGGDAVANNRIACNWKSKNSEGVEWIPLVFFGKLAEIAGEFANKGKQIFVSGRYRTRKWTDQSGADRYSTEIVVSDMQLLGGKGDNPQTSNQNPGANPQASQGVTGGSRQASQAAPPDMDDFSDDFPF